MYYLVLNTYVKYVNKRNKKVIYIVFYSPPPHIHATLVFVSEGESVKLVDYSALIKDKAITFRFLLGVDLTACPSLH